MKRRIKWSLAIILIFIFINTCIVSGSDTTTQDISITVEAINEISVSSGTVDLVINSTNANVSAGENLFSVSDSSTTMSYTTNESSKKISASLDAEFTDIVLKINVSPNNNTSVTTHGDVILSIIPTDVLSGINNASDTDMITTYTAEVQPTASPNTGGQHTVTFTLTDA